MMKNFLKKISRILYFSLALVIAFCLTYAISSISEKSKGPFTTLFDRVEEAINGVEHQIILNKREKHRNSEFKWFAKYKNDKQKLIKPKFILLGASDASSKNSFENIINLEDSLKISFPLIHIFSAWGSKPEQQFPEASVKAIYELGSIPVITWEPWISDFDEKAYNLKPLKERQDRSMLDVSEGVYDSYVKEWAIKAKKFGHPVYIRFGHEMNDPYRYPWGPMGKNRPSDYIKAWQHIHKVFSQQQADNIIWVWSPHVAYTHIDNYYPGDAYVDIVSTGILNYGTVAIWSKWWSFDELFGNHYEELDKFKKPIMISEFGSLEDGGDRAHWFADALHRLPEKYPSVTSIIFYHYPEDHTVTNRIVNWQIKKDSEALKAIKKEFKDILKFNLEEKKY
ncbi:glycoside hydrolase family 26 protein [Apibacter sp. HY039]|uniref:glycoside hydrolase family 26 protein n=1 Tax=Apibacter sp. HY039 TaxID=2501476 RepID=UPI000FEBE242|nr:glycosyl hydrolase [Apibacter sp. HY039]